MAGFTNAAEALLLDAIWTVLGTGGSLWLGLSTKANDDIISFPEASGSWGTPTYLTVHTALTSGTVVAFGALSPSQAIVSGNTVSIPIGDVVLKLGDPGDSY